MSTEREAVVAECRRLVDELSDSARDDGIDRNQCSFRTARMEDELRTAIDRLAALSAAPAASSDERIKAALADPVQVHAALLRGEIARPAIRDMLHVYGAEALARWDSASSDEQDARRSQWLGDRERLPSVRVDFVKPGVYEKHRVFWYERDEWHTTSGDSYEEAIDAAMKDARETPK